RQQIPERSAPDTCRNRVLARLQAAANELRLSACRHLANIALGATACRAFQPLRAVPVDYIDGTQTPILKLSPTMSAKPAKTSRELDPERPATSGRAA